MAGASREATAVLSSTITARPSVSSICTVSARNARSLSTCSMSSASLNNCATVAPLQAIAEHSPDFREEQVLLHRLGDVAVHPGPDAHLSIAGHGVGGHGDDRDLAPHLGLAD